MAKREYETTTNKRAILISLRQLPYNTPLYGLSSVPLITMIEHFEQVYEIHSNHF